MALSREIVNHKIYGLLLLYTTDYAVSRGKSYEKARQFALMRQYHIDHDMRTGFKDVWCWTL